MMFKKVSIVLAVLLIVCSYPSVSLGLTSDARKTLLANAIELCPQELRSYLEQHERIVTAGMLFVDRNRLRPTIGDIEDSFTCLVERMKSGSSNEYNTINKFGILASFISEAVSPGNAVSSLDNTIIRYDGFHEVTDIQNRVSSFMQKCRPYWRDNRKKARSHVVNVAANEIVDFWVSAWKGSGHNVTKLCRAGTEIKNEPPDYAFRDGGGGGKPIYIITGPGGLQSDFTIMFKDPRFQNDRWRPRR